MEIEVRNEADVTVIEAKGAMKVGEPGPKVWETTLEALDAGGRKIVLNLGGVTGLDSGGVGELVALQTSAEHRGGQVKLAELSPKVESVLQATQIVGVLEIYPYEADAITSFVTG